MISYIQWKKKIKEVGNYEESFASTVKIIKRPQVKKLNEKLFA